MENKPCWAPSLPLSPALAAGGGTAELQGLTLLCQDLPSGGGAVAAAVPRLWEDRAAGPSWGSLQGQRLSFVCPLALRNKSLCSSSSPLLGSGQDPCCPSHRDLLPAGPGHLQGDKGTAGTSLSLPGAGRGSFFGRGTSLWPSEECRTLVSPPWWLQEGHGDTSTGSSCPQAAPGLGPARLWPLPSLLCL